MMQPLLPPSWRDLDRDREICMEGKRLLLHGVATLRVRSMRFGLATAFPRANPGVGSDSMDTVNQAARTYAGMTENEILQAAERILLSRARNGELLSDPTAAGRVLRMRLAPMEREVFACIFLDTRRRILAIEDLFFGTVDGTEVHPREVVKSALLHNAAAVIVGHNHPSGNAEPSAADRAVTARLKQALALVDIRLLDHFMVTAGETPVCPSHREVGFDRLPAPRHG